MNGTKENHLFLIVAILDVDERTGILTGRMDIRWFR